MKPIDIIILVGAVVVVAGVVIAWIINRKKGKTSCGCDCAHCSGCKTKAHNSADTANKK